MMSLRSTDFSAFPDSPYAAALREGRQELAFDAAMEAEYVRTRLMQSRTLIRAACTLGVMLTGQRAAERLLSGAWHDPMFFVLLALLAGTIAMTAIAWSPVYSRIYQPVAHAIVPARNAIAAIPLATAVAAGHSEMLLFLPLMIVGPFFFLGLQFRVALGSVLLTQVAFVVAAILAGLALPFTIRVCAFQCLCVVACAVSARHFDKLRRTSFLESRLIAELIEVDALTGAKNRRVFDEQLARLWQQAITDGRAIAILLIDVDHFKAFNDRYGHQAGDHALRRVAQALKALVNRPQDVLTRYGGEEFAALLYDVDARQAEQLAEDMRHAILDLAIEHRASRSGATVSVSVGVAAIAPSLSRKPRGATQLADEALYEAKLRGRNTVVVLDDAEYRMLVTGVFSNQHLARGS